MSLDVRPFPFCRRFEKCKKRKHLDDASAFVKKKSAVFCSELLVNLVLGASADFELHFD